MTEDEAKTKRCPAIRVTPETNGYDPQTNRFEVAGAEASRCIGSACMAWRWTTIEMGPAVAHNGMISPTSYLPSTAEGYCGLAGKP